MPKLSDIRRIIPEDFEEEQQELVEKIGGSYNEFADELYQVVNGQLDFDNMERRKISVEVIFLESGAPKSAVNINSGLSSVSILYVGKVDNLTSPSAKLSQSPYIDWTHQGSGRVKINYGLGFSPGAKYRLTLELVK